MLLHFFSYLTKTRTHLRWSIKYDRSMIFPLKFRENRSKRLNVVFQNFSNFMKYYEIKYNFVISVNRYVAVPFKFLEQKVIDANSNWAT